MMSKQSALYPHWSVTFNPIGKGFAVIDFFIVFDLITFLAKRLQIPNKASSTFRDRFDMIDGEFYKWKLHTAFEAAKIIEFAKIIPFIIRIRTTGFGLSGSPCGFSSFCVLASFFGLLKSFRRFLSFSGPVMFTCPIPDKFLSGFNIFPTSLLSFFGCIISSHHIFSSLSFIVNFGILFLDGLAVFRLSVFSFRFLFHLFVFFSLFVSINRFLAFFRKSIIVCLNTSTGFTLISKSVISGLIFIKFTSIFNFLAYRTFFFILFHYGTLFKQKIKPPSDQLRKCQPAQLVSRWGSINYNTYEFIKQFVPGKVQVGTSNYTIFRINEQTVTS